MTTVKMWKLKDNKTLTTPSRIVFFDTESNIEEKGDVEVHTFKLATYRYYRFLEGDYKLIIEKTVFTPRELWADIVSFSYPKTTLWVIAHNQHYDFFVSDAFNQLRNFDFNFKSFSFESNLFFARFEDKRKRRILCIDSMNYFRTSIEEMGKIIGKEKGKVDFKSADLQTLVEYNKRDVEILSEFFIEFLRWWRKNDFGRFGISVPQLALRAFRHRFTKEKIIVHRDERALELEKASYFGGRCECFYIGKIEGKTIYKLDVNSMYPFVMKSSPYPLKLIGVLENPSLNYVKKLLGKYCLIARVVLHSQENVYPYRARKVIFPTGTFETVLTSGELAFALAKGHVVRVSKCSVYQAGYPFVDYVDYFYSLKTEAEKEGNKVKRAFAKLMLNSLYGKFGQEVYPYEEIEYPSSLDFGYEIYVNADTKERQKIIFINGKAYSRRREGKLSEHTFFAIASHVTGYARFYLYLLMKEAGLDHVYYVDTDSLFVDEEGYRNLQDFIGDKLGELKLEKKADFALFLAPKVYLLGDESKFKGLTRSAQKVSERAYKDLKFWRALTLISKGVIDRVIVEHVIKEFSLKYDKGKVLPDGKVIPWKLPDDFDTLKALKLVG
jgi:hypothetical protein